MVERPGRFDRAPESVLRSRVPHRPAGRDFQHHLPVLPLVRGEVHEVRGPGRNESLDPEFIYELSTRV
ncbi:MAG: hypothetical protein AUH81_12460 [Candidatus Rokubacteria bacterium 13_1_40CM_4_69_5]|nr:MAG: hypothetical protein AUH81_12460 [Candidatus Rokubacteria bacterium 13_1_40CM_4_69_5]